MVAITAAIVVSVWAGVWAEHRWRERAGLLAREAMLWVLWVILPPVVFFNLARADLDLDAGIGIGLALVAITVAATLAWLVGTRVLKLRRAQTGSLINAALLVNTGYLGYAMTAALLGTDRLGEAVAYDILVSGPGLLLGGFAIGAAFGDRAGEGVRERTIAFFTRNPALYAAVAALIAPEALAPDVLVDISRVVIIAILPLGFFAVGAVLAEEAEHGTVGFPPRVDGAVATGIVLRLIVAPGLLYLLALPLIDLPGPYLLLAAMPCGLNAMIVAHNYGLDLRIAAATITWSTAIVIVVALIDSLL
jgi:hypothetical protein